MIPQREETGSRVQWRSMKEQKKRKDTEIGRKKGMQGKKRKTKTKGDSTGLKVREGDMRKVEKASLKSTKE